MTYTIAVCTLLNSWWWTEKLSETCRVLLQKLIWGISASSWFYYKNEMNLSEGPMNTYYYPELYSKLNVNYYWYTCRVGCYDLEEQNSPNILYCNMEYPFCDAFVAFFYMFKYHSLKTCTLTATQWLRYSSCCCINIPFCCQISETGRETKTWKRNRKLKQDLES